jgi:hypothetical protein
MEFSAQVIAAAIAGFVSPFVQEILFGAKISGRKAGVITIATTFVIATLASWATGGFATAAAAPAFSFLDPSAFFAFWWKLWLPVYAIAQLVYSTTTKHADSPPATGPIQAVAEKVQPVIGTGSA